MPYVTKMWTPKQIQAHMRSLEDQLGEARSREATLGKKATKQKAQIARLSAQNRNARLYREGELAEANTTIAGLRADLAQRDLTIVKKDDEIGHLVERRRVILEELVTSEATTAKLRADVAALD